MTHQGQVAWHPDVLPRAAKQPLVARRAVRLQARLWDVSAGEQVARLTGHTDYVRAAAASPSSSDSWATGAVRDNWYV